jgi:hypothetical protein
MKKATLVLAVLAITLLAGCGRFDRFTAAVTGNASEECVDGVTYLQFTSGSSVKYTPDGHVATCKK